MPRRSMWGIGSTAALLLTIMVANVAVAQDKGIKPKAQWDAQYLKGPLPAGAADRYNGPQNPNPQVPSKYELIEPVSRRGVVAVHLTHVPGTDRYLYLSRPDCGQIAGSFDLVAKRWINVDSPDSVFCSGHAVTSNGSVIVTGGHSMKWSCLRRSDVKSYMRVAADGQGLCKDGKVLVVRYADGMRSIREYSASKDATKLPIVAQMADPRWYPTSTLLPDGKIMIMGGTRLPAKKDRNTDYEVFDPANPGAGTQSFAVEQDYLKAYPYNYYPFNFVLPTGDMFNFCKRISRVLIPQTGHYRKVQGQFVAAPDKPKPAISQYPHSGSAVMTALRPPYNAVDVVIFGGSNNGNCDPNRVADRKAYRMTISMDKGARGVPQYKFSEWQVEDMGIPRLMPDATLLPNGKVIVQNGAQTGCAGDAGPMGSAKAKYPALWAELYEPEKPVGKRYTILAASSIARMYHSTAALTTNGTILVSGCDRAGDSAGPGATITDAPWISRPLARHCETRQEIFHPPYTLQDPRKQPRITSVRGNRNRDVIIQLGYDEEFSLTWDTLGGAVRVSDATLVAPSSTTHSFNTNQRVVFLPKAAGSGNSRAGVLKLRTPPNPYIAPPQMYMLFALNGDYYGQSWWVQLVDKTGAGKKLPPV